jgi:hypothetical protein
MRRSSHLTNNLYKLDSLQCERRDGEQKAGEYNEDKRGDLQEELVAATSTPRNTHFGAFAGEVIGGMFSVLPLLLTYY